MPHRDGGSPVSAAAGFTLTELVVVIVLVSILSVFVAPRFAQRSNFAGELYLDELSAALSYSRTAAIASGCAVEFTINASGYAARRPATLCDTSSFTALLSDPSGDTVSASAPTDAVFSGSLPQTIRFQPDGSTNVSSDLSYSSGARTLLVYANSGVAALQ